MSLSKKERDKTITEEQITRLVNYVRDIDCEKSFACVQEYLSWYIKFFGKRYRIPGCDSEEIEQECLFALRYKAIEDFNPNRGKFKSFAILCIKRHLFSIIKSNNQDKRVALNKSLSLDENRSEDGEYLSLISLVVEEELSADEEFAKNEDVSRKQNELKSKLSKLEKEVFELYVQQYRYDEIVEQLKDIFPGKKCSKKSVDNALQRIRQKAQNMYQEDDWQD
jgi:RNA polymerase sporulation-specific sigma factor